jgi:hypothetical protein
MKDPQITDFEQTVQHLIDALVATTKALEEATKQIGQYQKVLEEYNTKSAIPLGVALSRPEEIPKWNPISIEKKFPQYNRREVKDSEITEIRMQYTQMGFSLYDIIMTHRIPEEQVFEICGGNKNKEA